MTKKTVGQLSTELIQKEPETRSPIEQMRESLTDYEKNIHECVDRGKKEFPNNFFVVVLTKKERLMPNVLRNYFTCRISCPTPNYDQTVYKYDRQLDLVEFIWTIPDRETCHLLRDNAVNVVKSERELLKFVLDFSDGTLYKLCKLLNGEKEDSPLLAA
jgi:hypothetical protein